MKIDILENSNHKNFPFLSFHAKIFSHFMLIEAVFISYSGTILDSYPFSQRMDALETSIDARYQFALNYLNVQVNYFSHLMFKIL